jgi:hypothetical protein
VQQIKVLSKYGWGSENVNKTVAGVNVTGKMGCVTGDMQKNTSNATVKAM